MTNLPDEPHYRRIYELSKQTKENGEDIKELKRSAKAAGINVPVLMEAVKRALADPDKLQEKRDREDAADALRKSLGEYADTPMGRAALDVAQ